VQLRHENDPEPWYITFGVDSSDAAGDPVAIGKAAMESFHAGFQSTLSPDVDITGCQVTVGQDGVEPVRSFVTPATALGGSAGDLRLPQNCALLVRKNTDIGGRRNRGRMFVPGILAEGAVSATGVITPAATITYLGYAENFFATLLAGLPNSPALPMVVLHSSGISTVPSPTVVSSVTVDNVISTQRRRLR
jgi:hypothetical protein